MAVDFTVIKELASLLELEAAWRDLAKLGGVGALFRGPDWLLPWWHAYHAALNAELCVLVGREEGELVCLAPFYIRTAKALVDVRELRMLGDAGPRPPALDLLVRPGTEERAGTALARMVGDLGQQGKLWDVVDLEPLADPSRIRANMIARLGSSGFTVESSPAAGGARRIALGLAPRASTVPPLDVPIVVHTEDVAGMRKGLSALRRLSRLEWAERDEHSPLADTEAGALLEEIAITQGRDGRARVTVLDDAAGEAIAATFVVDDGDRAVVLAMAVDPESRSRGAAERLLAEEAAAASARGRVALDVVTGALEYPLPPLPVSRQGALSVRVWNATRSSAVARRVEGVRRRARAVRETPGVAASQARAAWARIRTAAQEVAQYQRMHLYRGQLWTRGIAPAPGLTIAPLNEADFDALPPAGRADLAEQLTLDENIARPSWRRGDLSLLARLHDRPAGIAWAARGPVEVPELGRTLSLSKYEAYIHDVFVAGSARGRAVAPVMLAELAKIQRELDVYRSWALLGADNQPSRRAFEKA
ncbi:MAG TPA: GNAT family N-acetyltransferase, partial [Kofleriaceae bacterium]|nr:GNAT family N-acetyltransferase [Kofleriaceae bacterium]